MGTYAVQTENRIDLTNVNVSDSFLHINTDYSKT